MPETKEHLDLRTALYLVLRSLFSASAWVGSDQFVYYDASDPSRVVAPDLFVRRGGPDEQFSSWKTWERGAPELAVEIVSESDASPAGWEKKLSRYHAMGVAEVVRFEAQSPRPLRIWDRVADDLVERRIDTERSASRVLGLDFVVVKATLRLAREGVILPTPDERAEAESLRAEAASLRAEAASARAEAESLRAGQNAARADAAATIAERLRARLLAAGLDPDE